MQSVKATLAQRRDDDETRVINDTTMLNLGSMSKYDDGTLQSMTDGAQWLLATSEACLPTLVRNINTNCFSAVARIPSV